NAATGAFSWTPSESQGPGTYTFTVKVTDNGSPPQSDQKDITVTVNEVNLAPTLEGVPTEVSIPEMATYNFTATATDDDIPAQNLVFSLVGAPAGASIGASTGVFTWNPSEAQGPGDYTFSVSVSDGVTHTDNPITIHVTEVNQPPVLDAVGDKAV